jgi:FHA domain-containing protein
MTTRTCVECGLAAAGSEDACRICGGLVPARSWLDEPGGDTVPLPSSLLGPRADDAAGGPGGRWDGDLLRILLAPGTYVVEVRRGEQVVLGRDRELSPHAGYFGAFEDVSRRHVTLRLDADGHAFVRDEYSTNWTIRNGSRLTPGTERRLRGGDQVRLGSHVCGLVELVAVPARLPGPGAG